jgi:hypothetical protein
MPGNWYFWEERLQGLMLSGELPWFADQGTPGKEGRDQVEPFMNGEKRYWWFSDREIANHAKTEQTLAPR